MRIVHFLIKNILQEIITINSLYIRNIIDFISAVCKFHCPLNHTILIFNKTSKKSSAKLTLIHEADIIPVV